MRPITVIIPTIAGREEALQQVFRGLEAQTVGSEAFEVIVVQDGGGGEPDPLAPIAVQTRIIRHAERRGAAAARNSAIAQTRTPFGFFLDDDIIPSSGVLEAHLAFLRAQTDPLIMGAGRVTWEGHPHYNGLMDWMEHDGDWSLFSRLEPGQCFPYWVSGFTSFHTQTLRRIPFNEAFTRYGCEDHELGYRFFRQGGRLRFVDGAPGLHLKPLSGASLYLDYRRGSWSKWVLFQDYPDLTGTPTALLTSIQMEHQGEDPEPIIRMLDRFSNSAHNRMKVSTDLLIRFLCGVGACHGAMDHWRSEYPGFDEAAEVLFQGFAAGTRSLPEATAAALEICPTMPWIRLYAARHTEDPHRRVQLLEGLLEQAPSYSLVFLEHLEQLTERQEVERAVDTFSAFQAPRLERSTAQAWAYRAATILLRYGSIARAVSLLEDAAEFECWDEGQTVCARRALGRLAELREAQGEHLEAQACRERQFRMSPGAVQDVSERARRCGPTESLLAARMEAWLDMLGVIPTQGVRS